MVLNSKVVKLMIDSEPEVVLFDDVCEIGTVIPIDGDSGFTIWCTLVGGQIK